MKYLPLNKETIDDIISKFVDKHENNSAMSQFFRKAPKKDQIKIIAHATHKANEEQIKIVKKANNIKN